MSVNKVILVGRLGKEPEMRYTTSGDAVCNFSVATSENWKDKNGEKQEKVDWHNLVAYKKLAEICGQYLKKGSQVYVDGKLTTRKWQDKDGKDRYTTEVIINEMRMLGGGEKSEQRQESKPAPKAGGAFDDFEDDIPF